MKSAHRARLGAALKAALAADPLRPECLGFSHLGFAELTRRRVRPPLSELTA
jgi:Ribonuclease G/E